MVYLKTIGLVALSAMLLLSCKKDENFNVASADEYYPLQVGRTFIYRMDSMVTPPFAARIDTFRYMAKDSIVEQFADNNNRPSFRVFRYVRDTAQTKPWQYRNTYYITRVNNGIELVENNLRFIKLRTPVRDFFTWKGNAYIETTGSSAEQYGYLDEWDYYYTNVNKPYTVRKGTFDSTATVMQQDYMFPEGPFNPSHARQDRDYSIEVYAKGVGLIYKEFLHWTWQASLNSFEANSYGIRLNLVDYK